ncbi:GDSL esterase/lipase 5 [Rosa sericea]
MASLQISLFGQVIMICVMMMSSCHGAFATDPVLDTSVALFVFGDSTVDTGNNNYITTVPENQAHYKPYGQNGFFDHPTGRFSDGRVIVDYIAEYAKLPMIPPFLGPSADYINGVNFASGGAGVLPETNQGSAIDLPTQLIYFEEVQKRLTKKFGEEKAKEVISEAVYFISIGSNDYMGGYLGNPKMQEQYNPEQYVGMVIGNLTQAIQVLYEKGGRKFGFLRLSPLGCLPAFRAVNLRATKGGRGCFEGASALALAHNDALNTVLGNLGYVLKEFKYCSSDFYDWLRERIDHPNQYGFKDGINACCGSGPYGGSFTCGGTKEDKDYQVCNNADDYVWWDSFHPTERIHEQLAKALWNGPPSSVGPYNLEGLFFEKEKLTIGSIVDKPEADQFQSF